MRLCLEFSYFKSEAEPLDIDSQAEPGNQLKSEAEPLDIDSQAEPGNQLTVNCQPSTIKYPDRFLVSLREPMADFW